MTKISKTAKAASEKAKKSLRVFGKATSTEQMRATVIAKGLLATSGAGASAHAGSALLPGTIKKAADSKIKQIRKRINDRIGEINKEANKKIAAIRNKATVSASSLRNSIKETENRIKKIKKDAYAKIKNIRREAKRKVANVKQTAIKIITAL
jgi:hypothetical protein